MTTATRLPFTTWAPPVEAVLFKGTDYRPGEGDHDLFCTRCGLQTVRSYPAYVGGRGYQMVQTCTAWWEMPSGEIIECGVAA